MSEHKYYKGNKKIDLTEFFGEGNEPTDEQIDNLILSASKIFPPFEYPQQEKVGMTPREALEYLRPPLYTTENKDKAYRNLESLVLAAEQAPTLKKLGYRETLGTNNFKIRRWQYDNAEKEITISVYQNYDAGKIFFEKRMYSDSCLFDDEEIFACAEFIKQIKGGESK